MTKLSTCLNHLPYSWLVSSVWMSCLPTPNLGLYDLLEYWGRATELLHSHRPQQKVSLNCSYSENHNQLHRAGLLITASVFKEPVSESLVSLPGVTLSCPREYLLGLLFFFKHPIPKNWQAELCYENHRYEDKASIQNKSFPTGNSSLT